MMKSMLFVVIRYYLLNVIIEVDKVHLSVI